MRVDRERVNKDIFITFHDVDEPDGIESANKLSRALNCQVVSFKAGQLDQISTPTTQKRVAFHGDGSQQNFGSHRHYLNPNDFAKELIKFLKNNPNITDVDLLSCNLGLIDKNDSCYALIVQEHLDANGYGHVNVNTFKMDNKDNSISESFFILGLKNDPNSKTLGENLFSLDVLRKDNTKQVAMNSKFDEVQKEQLDLEAQIKLLIAIKGLVSEKKSANITFEHLRKRLENEGYSQSQATQILTDYNVQVHDHEYVTCNLFPQKEYLYPEDVRTDINKIEIRLNDKNKELEKVSKEFAVLRTTEASTTRMYKDEIAQIQKYLTPMRHVISAKLMDRVATLRTPNKNFNSKMIGALIENISNTYKGKRLHEDLKKLDIYIGFLADIFKTYKTNTPQETNAFKTLATFIGNAYQNCITEGKDVDECINDLKMMVKHICVALKTTYQETDSPSPKNFSGSGFTTFQSRSLSQQLLEAMIKSDQTKEILATQSRKETTSPAH